MIEHREIHYWHRYWTNPFELVGQLAIVLCGFFVAPIVIVQIGLTSGLLDNTFIIIFLGGIVVFIGGLAFFPYQPVRIKLIGSQLFIKKHILWNGISMDGSRIIGWTYSSTKPFIVLKIADEDSKLKYALDASGWFWIPVQGMGMNDLEFLLKIFEQRFKRETWDIGLVN
jgi:hypothetical protein